MNNSMSIGKGFEITVFDIMTIVASYKSRRKFRFGRGHTSVNLIVILFNRAVCIKRPDEVLDKETMNCSRPV